MEMMFLILIGFGESFIDQQALLEVGRGLKLKAMINDHTSCFVAYFSK